MEYPDQSKKKEENPASLQKRKEWGGTLLGHSSFNFSFFLNWRKNERSLVVPIPPLPKEGKEENTKSLLLFVRLFGSAGGGAHFV